MKKWIAIGISAGGGFALVSAAIIAGVLWHSSRPVQWNTGALTASGGEIELRVVDKAPGGQGDRQIELQTGFRVSYTIENTTNRDITLPTGQVLTRRESDGALDAPRVPIDTPLALFVPAHQRMLFHLSVTYACDDIWRKAEKDHRAFAECFAQILGGTDSWMVVDQPQHLQLLLPKPHWNAGGVKVFVDTKP